MFGKGNCSLILNIIPHGNDSWDALCYQLAAHSRKSGFGLFTGCFAGIENHQPQRRAGGKDARERLRIHQIGLTVFLDEGHRTPVSNPSPMPDKMQNMKVKQSVEYNGKRYTLPFLVAKESLSTEQETVRNRFGGESCTLPAFAFAVLSKDGSVRLSLQCPYSAA